MSNPQRIALIREKLGPCQVALAKLLDAAWQGRGVVPWADELQDCFLDLEAAIGAPCTPTILYENTGLTPPV